jgi:Arc/MetJ family transcription regulator
MIHTGQKPEEPLLDKGKTSVYANTHQEVHMRTNIVLDESLVEEGLKLSGAKTRKELVNQALRELVENRKRRNLMDLAGKIKFADKYDYKRAREEK